MIIKTINKQCFKLVKEDEAVMASLQYAGAAYNDAVVETDEHIFLNGIATGLWITYQAVDGGSKIKSKIRVETGGVISVRLLQKKKKYHFKKSAGWKLRFSLMNKDGEELLTLVPIVNWEKESHDFILQLNDEFENECDSFLILQAVHCANCSLSMMTGGEVPALINV
jgi:hypothetical protein